MEKQDPSNTEDRSTDFSAGVQAVAASTKEPVEKESYKSKKGSARSAGRKRVKAATKQTEADKARAAGKTAKADRKERAAARKTKKAEKLEKRVAARKAKKKK